jgi:uncharacterized protein YjbJ (UPF0337 family)
LKAPALPSGISLAPFSFAWRFANLPNHGVTIMAWDQIEGAWKRMRGKVKEKWGELTDDDLDVIDGRRDQLVGKLQQRYGRTKDEIEAEVREWERITVI